MPIESSEPFAVFSPPDGRDVVLRCAEQKITVIVVLDDCDRPFMAL
jgi:hypothetical protein